jgi:hypothetical protein
MKIGNALIALTIALLAASLLQAQDQASLTVDATMDIYRAGGYSDGSNGIAPVVFSFPARAWQTMTFSSVGGARTCQTGFAESDQLATVSSHEPIRANGAFHGV